MPMRKRENREDFKCTDFEFKLTSVNLKTIDKVRDPINELHSFRDWFDSC